MANLGINLLWLSVVFQAIDTLLLWLNTQSDPNSSIVFPVIVLVFSALLVSKIAAGRTWARIFFLVLVVLELAALFLSPGVAAVTFGRPGIRGLLGGAIPVLEIVGTFMLFIPSASEQFRS